MWFSALYKGHQNALGCLPVAAPAETPPPDFGVSSFPIQDTDKIRTLKLLITGLAG
ncbi:hypothetical protein MY1884_002438 [Beauveria asiatica]